MKLFRPLDTLSGKVFFLIRPFRHYFIIIKRKNKKVLFYNYGLLHFLSNSYLYIWAVLIVRRRKPSRKLKDITRREKILGVAGIILLDKIRIHSGFISPSIDISSKITKRRRRRDTPDTPGKHSLIYFFKIQKKNTPVKPCNWKYLTRFYPKGGGVVGSSFTFKLIGESYSTWHWHYYKE